MSSADRKPGSDATLNPDPPPRLDPQPAEDAHDTIAIESDLSDAGGCRRRLSIKVAPDDVAREFGETVKRYARAVRMPGFRRGKVPVDMVRRRFAQEIEEEVRDHLVRHGLQEAFGRHKLFPLHNPVVEGGKVVEGEPYGYSALFEVRPELRMGEYKGLKVSLPEAKVGDEDVEKALTALRERLARFVGVDPRPLVKGDFALVDLEGRDVSGK